MIWAKRHVLRVLCSLALSLALAGCFISQGLFERERIWDPAWFGRYEAKDGVFVVLPDNPAARTYLIGSFEREKTKVDVSRVALYRGWDDVMIIGSLVPGRAETRPAYSLLRPLGHDRFASQWPDCSEDFASRHQLARDNNICSIATLDEMRALLKAWAADKAKNPPDPESEPEPFEHRRDHPLSTIGVTASAGFFTDSEGVHGGLKLINVPAASPAAKAGLKPGDQIFAVGNARPAIGEELLLRIAVAAPGTNLVVTIFDGKTHAKRDVTIVTAAID